MKHLTLIAFVVITFAACNTKETKDTETVTTQEPAKTVVIHDQAPPATPPAPEKQNKVEINLTDSGSGIKVRIP